MSAGEGKFTKIYNTFFSLNPSKTAFVNPQIFLQSAVARRSQTRPFMRYFVEG
jgi:hypothetical protein